MRKRGSLRFAKGLNRAGFVVKKTGVISKPVWETQKKSLARSLPDL
jgi:hypothetical protein